VKNGKMPADGARKAEQPVSSRENAARKGEALKESAADDPELSNVSDGSLQAGAASMQLSKAVCISTFLQCCMLSKLWAQADQIDN
jgi:hypothetical protein